MLETKGGTFKREACLSITVCLKIELNGGKRSAFEKAARALLLLGKPASKEVSLQFPTWHCVCLCGTTTDKQEEAAAAVVSECKLSAAVCVRCCPTTTIDK